jgi:hypothetical protein
VKRGEDVIARVVGLRGVGSADDLGGDALHLVVRER